MRRQELQFLYSVDEVITACQKKALHYWTEARRYETEYEEAHRRWQNAIANGTATTTEPKPPTHDKSTDRAAEFTRWERAFKRLHGNNKDGKVALHMEDIAYFGLDS